MYFPSYTTVIIQPMDQGIIERLKRIYKIQILQRLLLVNN